MRKSIQVGVLALFMSTTLVACAPNGTQSTTPPPNSTTSNSTNPASSQSGTNNGGTGSSGSNSTASGSTTNKTNSTSSPSKTGSTSNTASHGTNAGSSTASSSNASTVPSGPLPGDLLIADRGNSRLLIVTPQKKIVWSMTIGNGKGPKGSSSLGADDAFFTPDYKHIIINEEDNQVIAVIDIATKQIIWHYGHAGVPGSKPGYLNTPDDAYMLPNGIVTVADIKNMRILFINQKGQIVKQYGNGLWRHNPPYSYASPNGDTPLPDGGTLITEINGSYADRLDKNGKLLYTVHFPNIPYPSDTQLLKNGNLLTADYESPGKIEEVTPQGKIVWEYYKTSGPGMLSNPSLTFQLPNGDFIVNDDSNDRVVIIDPKTNQIVWQYGHTRVAGTAPGYLNTPDGMDFLPPNVHIPGVN
ncbi:hypothetical protein JZ785_15680 [Alicyclobacillus curvatus]|nr:hypothetical protein JZ785_15680 [Alicyclobacillus curvatus]